MLWQTPDIGFSLRNQCRTLFDELQVIFFVVGCWLFYFCNRLRHKGLLLLVCCWLAPGFCQSEKIGHKKIPILMDGDGVLFVGILAKFPMMFSFKFQSLDHVFDGQA
tara:strand:+ start:479 stop:799 length:321 start_codon:yes stop_codon:yes gene_type:complete